MIISFGDTATDDLYHARNTSRMRRFPQNIMKGVLRKLDMLNGAQQLLDLHSLPSNRLEALKGDLQGFLQGFHSIRVNDQWRLIFRWTEGSPADVSLVDYH